MTRLEVDSDGGEFSLLIRPHLSLSTPGAIGFVALCAIFIALVASVMAALGAWLVLPFAGAEILLIVSVFWLLQRRRQDYELVVGDPVRVTLTKHRLGETRQSTFQRYWTQVVLHAGIHRGHPSKLMVGSHGRFLEIGSVLIEKDRLRLASKLKCVLARSGAG